MNKRQKKKRRKKAMAQVIAAVREAAAMMEFPTEWSTEQTVSTLEDCIRKWAKDAYGVEITNIVAVAPKGDEVIRFDITAVPTDVEFDVTVGGAQNG
jgi:hypothetical protein